ncbi:uncharacterized protein [Dysidea avara]
MSSEKAREYFEATTTYTLLKSQAITKAGSQLMLFLRDTSCKPYCASVECYENLTPSPLNGTSKENEFDWWATLITGFYRFCAETDPTVNLMHIWNEPNTVLYRDHKNGSYYADFYVAVAESIKKEFPNVIIGGPVLADDPAGRNKLNSTYSMWNSYSKPLIDAALPKGLLDYYDFHAYDGNGFPQPLMGGLHTVDAYTFVEYNTHMASGITESNMKIFNISEEYVRSSHYNLRTFLLILSTMALLKHPDKIITRMLFDYKAPGKVCNCPFNGYPNNTNVTTPEMEAYYLLGKLRDGTRLFVDVPSVDVSEDCTCQPAQSIQYGNSTILVEAALTNDNLTIVIVNMCDCEVELSGRVTGVDQVVSSWAAILDVQSLRETVAPQLPDLSTSLPPMSLVTISYTLNKSQHFTSTNTVSFVQFYPTSSKQIMLQTDLYIKCNYSLLVSYDLSDSNVPNVKESLLRFGVLGPAENYTWNITINCPGISDNVDVSVYRPGAYTEVRLPCVPDTDSDGVTTVKYTVVTCDEKDHLTSPAAGPEAYFEFSVLVMRY